MLSSNIQEFIIYKLGLSLDVTDYGRLEEVVEDVDQVTNGSGINLLINNSGVLRHVCKGILDVTRCDILMHVETNTIAPIMITQV